jgi:hypothetical protein
MEDYHMGAARAHESRAPIFFLKILLRLMGPQSSSILISKLKCIVVIYTHCTALATRKSARHSIGPSEQLKVGPVWDNIFEHCSNTWQVHNRPGCVLLQQTGAVGRDLTHCAQVRKTHVGLSEPLTVRRFWNFWNLYLLKRLMMVQIKWFPPHTVCFFVLRRSMCDYAFRAKNRGVSAVFQVNRWFCG